MNVLTVEHLTKKIGKKTILEDVSLKLDQGQIAGLVGANGAGKTTLMKVIQIIKKDNLMLLKINIKRAILER